MTNTLKKHLSLVLGAMMLMLAAAFLSPDASANEYSNNVFCHMQGGIVPLDQLVPDCDEGMDHLFD